MATINNIGIPGIGTGILQPRIKNRFRVSFSNIGGGIDSQPLARQVINITRPKLSFEEIQLDRYNSRGYVAAKHTWEPMTITVEDDVLGSASRVIQAQISAQQFLIGAEGQWLATAQEGSNYKFSTIIDTLDGNELVTERWIIEGCWIQNPDWGDLDYAASEAVQITLAIRFDHARQDILTHTPGQGSAIGGTGPA